MNDQQIQDFLSRAAEDDDFAAELEADPIAALRASGFDELADAAGAEEERLARIAARISEDDDFRTRIEDDPATALRGELPEHALKPFLAAIGAPDEVVERATGDVEAHLKAPAAKATAVVAVLGTLAFAQQASAAEQPNPARYGSEPGAAVQPGAVRYGEPSGFRFGAEPSGFKWGAQPNPIRWGAKPNPWRYGEPSGFRYSKASWQALRLQVTKIRF